MNKIFKFFTIIFLLNYINFAFGQLRLEFAEFDENYWIYYITDNHKEISHVAFSQLSKDEGYINYFYFEPKYRSKNYDILLMRLALKKLFKTNKVEKVTLFASPYEKKPKVSNMPIEVLRNYYNKKFGFIYNNVSGNMEISKENFYKNTLISSSL